MKSEFGRCIRRARTWLAIAWLIFASNEALAWAVSDSTAPREPMVIDVYRLGHESESGEDRISAGIGDIVVVKVRHLQTLVDRARCLNDAGDRNPECIEQ